jgi:hypothetical protein
MKNLKAALVVAMLLPAAGAFAQAIDAPQMMASLSMLETNAVNAFDHYDINADVQDLSLGQLAAIVGVLNDPNANSGGASAKASIEAIIRNN